jgi:RNA polymerase sigma-70 factor (ECF subfamily)
MVEDSNLMPSPYAGGQASEADLQLVATLRAGDEAAFANVVNQYFNAMVRIAMIYVNDPAVAEEVVQETWLAALKGLDRFEGRSSFKTWLFTILTNRARTRATRESRYLPLNTSGESDDDEPSVAPERFTAADHWSENDMPQSWDRVPEASLLSQETMDTILKAISALPPNQREVIRMRDVEGFSSAEVCNILSLSETNQRVLLHRARSRVRQTLESYMATEN